MEDKSARSRQDRSNIRLKKSIVDAEPLPPRGKRTVLWDSELKGFGVRISANGGKTYILRYRTGGRETSPRTYTIGQHGSPFTTEQARTRAIELLMEIRSGGDPAADRQAEREQVKAEEAGREERLFDAMAEEWFMKHVKRAGLHDAKTSRRY